MCAGNWRGGQAYINTYVYMCVYIYIHTYTYMSRKQPQSQHEPEPPRPETPVRQRMQSSVRSSQHLAATAAGDEDGTAHIERVSRLSGGSSQIRLRRAAGSIQGLQQERTICGAARPSPQREHVPSRPPSGSQNPFGVLHSTWSCCAMLCRLLSLSTSTGRCIDGSMSLTGGRSLDVYAQFPY